MLGKAPSMVGMKNEQQQKEQHQEEQQQAGANPAAVPPPPEHPEASATGTGRGALLYPAGGHRCVGAGSISNTGVRRTHAATNNITKADRGSVPLAGSRGGWGTAATTSKAAGAAAGTAANKKAQPPAARATKRAAKPPVRPLTPTIIEVLDSDEEGPEWRVRFDEGIQRQVPMTPGRQLDLEAYGPPPPPPPSRWQEMVGVAWPAEVAQEARRLVKGARRRSHLVWCEGRRYQVRTSQGRVRVFRDQQQQQ
ncbi:hypothetical protein ACLKA7_000770 [Drosophila subpalustris]